MYGTCTNQQNKNNYSPHCTANLNLNICPLLSFSCSKYNPGTAFTTRILVLRSVKCRLSLNNTLPVTSHSSACTGSSSATPCCSIKLPSLGLGYKIYCCALLSVMAFTPAGWLILSAALSYTTLSGQLSGNTTSVSNTMSYNALALFCYILAHFCTKVARLPVGQAHFFLYLVLKLLYTLVCELFQLD